MIRRISALAIILLAIGCMEEKPPEFPSLVVPPTPLPKELPGEPAATKATAYRKALEGDPNQAAKEIGQNFDPEQVTKSLHEAGAWKKVRPGRYEIAIETDSGDVPLAIRIPKGYDPAKAYPLIFALHYKGGTGPAYIDMLESALGDRLEKFIVAGPTDFNKNMLDRAPPEMEQHIYLLQNLKRQVHIDSDRVYAMGTSLGGLLAWNYIALYPQEWAAMISHAAALTPAEYPWIVKQMLESAKHIPIASIYGASDHLEIWGLGGQVAGAQIVDYINEVNPKVEKIAKTVGNEIKTHAEPGADHMRTPLPEGLFDWATSKRRVHYPAKVQKIYRWLNHCRAYWVEGLEWKGEKWYDRQPPGYKEDPNKALKATLGYLTAEAKSNRLAITCTHLAKLRIWLGDDLIDWNRPVEIIVNGKQVFSGRVQRDLALALSEAKRTYDFERLRWAKVDIDIDIA